MSYPDPYNDIHADAARALNAGIEVTLGGRRIVFRMLPIDQDLEWRRRMADIYCKIAEAEKTDSIGPMAILRYLATDGMDEMVAACFMLAPTVNQADAIRNATRTELVELCRRVLEEYYCPFVVSLLGLYRTAVPA